MKSDRIDLKELINRCIDHLRYLDGYDEIAQDVEIMGGPIFFNDEYRMSVALTNVISNGLKYQDRSKAKRFLNIVASITPDTVKILVKDNGLGIHENLLPKVFDMFYRANENSQGAGLGLYITKEVVEKMGGTLDIASELYQGTTVSLTLPNRMKIESETQNPAEEYSQ